VQVCVFRLVLGQLVVFESHLHDQLVKLLSLGIFEGLQLEVKVFSRLHQCLFHRLQPSLVGGVLTCQLEYLRFELLVAGPSRACRPGRRNVKGVSRCDSAVSTAEHNVRAARACFVAHLHGVDEVDLVGVPHEHLLRSYAMDRLLQLLLRQGELLKRVAHDLKDALAQHGIAALVQLIDRPVKYGSLRLKQLVISLVLAKEADKEHELKDLESHLFLLGAFE